MLVSHLPCPLPPNQSVICLAPCHQTSQLFDLPSTTSSLHHCATMSPHHHVTMLVSHLPCPLPPNQSVICLASCHQTSQSFALPPATKPVSHLTCPLPPHHLITASPRHHVTMLVSQLPCPLPPNQSVICFAPCHQTSKSFDLPSTTVSPHHRVTLSPCYHITASPHHCLKFSPSHGYESDWLMLTSTVLIGYLSPPQPIRSLGLKNLIIIKS